jgi:putative ABC transport system permease protein
MRPGAVAGAVRGGLGRRRRVQTVVIAAVLLVSTASAVLGLALVVDSNAPFDRAFASQRGAQIVASIDPSRVTPSALAATRGLAPVTEAAGPFAVAEISGTDESNGYPAPVPLPPLSVAGRSSPGGPVDDVALQSGHWAQRPGQIVVDANGQGGFASLGDSITVTSARGRPRLTVVGLATSASNSAGAWVAPAEIAMLREPGQPHRAQMLYRFRDAGTAAAIAADEAAVTRALPAKAVTGAQSYLGVKAQQTNKTAVYAPFVIAFAVIGLVMSVLIVASVVSGAVVTGYHRIGVLKSIGFTPAQVVAAYTGQIAVPAAVGCLGGMALGNLLAVPLLRRTATVYGVGSLGVPVWVDVAVAAAMGVLVGIAAVLPAFRAGRLSAVAALAAGRAPRTGHGYAAHRLLGRLPLPRPVTIGLASPFARPARMAATLVAVLLGVTAVTFAVGLTTSLRRASNYLELSNSEQVQLSDGGPNGPPPDQENAGNLRASNRSAAAQEGAVTAAIRAEPGTLHYVLEDDGQYVNVPDLTQAIPVTAFVGNAGWTGYALIKGHWYTGSDQVDAPTAFLKTTGTRVGDTITLTAVDGRRIPVRIVGELFTHDPNQGVALFTSWQTLTGGNPALIPDPSDVQYDVGLRPGVNSTTYADALAKKLGPDYNVNPNLEGGAKLALALVGTLTLLLAIAAALGVLNAVVLYTRERAHDLAVLKTVGMTPRQTVAMVVSTVLGTGLLAGLLAVPIGIVVHNAVLPVMAAADNLGVPPGLSDVYGTGEVVALALAGIAIAVAGAMLPASWSAQTRTGPALHAE